MRLVLAEVASLQEIETHWSLCDILEFNEWLDYRSEAEEERDRQMKAEMKK